MRSYRAYLALLLAILLSHTSHAKHFTKAADTVKLEDIQALTFHKNRLTAHRRVDAIPQISVVGGNAAGSGFVPETVRCRNAGYSYGPDDIEWTCTASMPPEMKLGSTEVVCEGYDSPDDPFILKGSCGVELRLVLTDVGERKLADQRQQEKSAQKPMQGQKSSYKSQRNGTSWLSGNFDWSGVIFGIIFFSVLAFILYGLVKAILTQNRPGTTRRPRASPRAGPRYGGNSDDDDPPPPYDPGPSPDRSFRSSRGKAAPKRETTRSSQGGRSSQSARGGLGQNFWTGAAAGAAAGAATGYFAGQRRGARQQTQTETTQPQQQPGSSSEQGSNVRYFNFTHNQNSAPRAPSPPSSSSPSYSTERYESTGFGGTRRR